MYVYQMHKLQSGPDRTPIVKVCQNNHHKIKRHATLQTKIHSTGQPNAVCLTVYHARTECSDRCVSDLGSLAEELLFDPQSLFLHLDLLQSDLVVATHYSTLRAGGQLGALLHWSTLGNSLLVHR